jgi:RND family efflux transporter MFP subunit
VAATIAGIVLIAPKPRALPIDVMEIRTEPTETVLSFTGRVEAVEDAELSSSLSATRVEKVLVDVGETVVPGQPVLQLDQSELQAQRSQAMAALASAQGQLVREESSREGAQRMQLLAREAWADPIELRASRDSAREQVRIEEKALAAAKAQLERTSSGARFEEVSRAEAAVRAAEAVLEERAIASMRLDSAQTNFATATEDVNLARASLEAARTPRREDVSEATARLRQAEASLKAAQKNLENRELVLSTRQALRSNLQSAETQLQVSQASVSTAVAEVERCMASLQQIDASMSKTLIRAPIAGVVSRRQIKPGEIAQPGALLLRITSQENFRLVADVDEQQLWQLKSGQSAVARPDAIPTLTLSAQVDEISKAASPERGTVPVRFRLDKRDYRLRAGLSVDINVVTASYDRAVIIPNQAIRREGGKAEVFKVVDGKAQRVGVVLGQSTDRGSLLRSGLSPGDKIVVDPRMVKDGDFVPEKREKA